MAAPKASEKRVMAASAIRRKQGPPDPDGFEGLKQEGLRLAQELSGAFWTDYNLHDPGVTILEQLCFALTDLIYRADFPVEDFLTKKEDGSIDFTRQALHLPEHIFPTRPITLMDYRKVLLDAVPELGGVWITPATDEQYPGLYHLTVKFMEDLPEGELEAVLEHIQEVYRRHRNLGEDLHGITILDSVECELVADIRIAGGRDPDHLVAELYAQCAQYVAREPQNVRFDQLMRAQASPEVVLRGPLPEHGFIDERALQEGLDELVIDHRNPTATEERLQTLSANLFSVVRGLEGVDYVSKLAVKPAWDMTQTAGVLPASPSALRLRIPRRIQDLKVRMIKNGTALPLSLSRIRTRFEELNFKGHSLRRTRQQVSTQDMAPKGTYRNFQRYSSVQRQFPNIYGINAYGVPESAPNAVKGRAAQLKAFLLLFDQIMANFMASLHHVDRVVSPDDSPPQTYFFQELDALQIPGVDKLYGSDPPEILRAVFLEGYDAKVHGDRKNRYLDYLLALYGERFSQSSLRHFNFYHAPDEIEQVMLTNKMAFLKALPELSRHRFSGFHDGQPAWNTDNVSSLKKKVSLLLGFHYVDTRSLTDVFIENGVELITDEQLTQVKEGAVEIDFVDLGDIEDRINQEFQEWTPDSSLEPDPRRLFQEIVFLKNNVVSPSILRYGIYPDRYRVGSTGKDQSFQVVFRPQEESRWDYLATYPTPEEAGRAVQDLRNLLITLNVESEGLHLVEHILLRPESREAHPLGVPDDFYSFRLSVLFPAWSARCADREFRTLAEDTVRLNCPAHLYPEIFWLDFPAMRTFERLFKEWLECKGAGPQGHGRLKEAEWELTKYLLKIRAVSDDGN